jgi:hypothetical protein
MTRKLVGLLLMAAALSAQRMTVQAVSHSFWQTNYELGNQQKAIVHLNEVVVGEGTQYTLERVTRMVWESNASLVDGDYFEAERKGSHMTIYTQKGGNRAAA